MASGWNSRGLALLLLASFFLALGLLFDHMPAIVDSEIKRNLQLATSELTRTFWSKPPVDIHTYYWLFPISNPEKFLVEGERLQVRKLGPFHFSSRMEKQLGPLSNNKFRITYNSTRHFRLNESQPELLEAAGFDQPAAYLNVIYASLVGATAEFAHQTEDPLQQRLILSGAQRLTDKYNETLLLNTTAREILLGRQVPMLVAAAKLARSTGLDAVPIPMTADNKFGLVALQNGTWSGPYEVYTGYQASQGSLGDLISYQGRKRLEQFQGRCSRLQTSAGELRPMPIRDQQVLEMFQPQMCRVLSLVPTGSRRLPNGQAISYRLNQADFSSALNNPQNRCFCLNKTRDNYCSLEGVIEIGPCAFYAPMLIHANGIRLDERITANIANWDPDLFRSDPEPLPPVDANQQMLVLKRLGVPFHVDLTITVFIKVKRDERFRHTRSVPEVSYVPLAMVRELVNIPPGLNQIIVHLESFLLLAEHLKVVFYLSSVALVCWLTGHFYARSEAAAGAPLQRAVTGSSSGGGGAPPPATGPRTWRRPSDEPAANEDLASRRQQPPPALIFSQVDKLRTANLQKRSSRVADLQPAAGPQLPVRANGLRRSEPTSGELPAPPSPKLAPTPDLAAAADAGRRISEAPTDFGQRQPGAPVESHKSSVDSDQPAGNADDDDDDDDGLSAAANQAGATRLGAPPNVKGLIRRKNWIVKIYSNLLNMLGDIRQTINSAGQLDVASNSHQDKQLEMLAGRIDNWQRPSAATTPASSPAPPPDDAAPTTESAAHEPEPEEAPGEAAAARAESVQSDETVVAAATAAAVEEASSNQLETPRDEDKARALERMELALEFASSPEPPLASESRHKSARPLAGS